MAEAPATPRRRRPPARPVPPCLACQGTTRLPQSLACDLPCPVCRERAGGWQHGLSPADHVALAQAYLDRIAGLVAGRAAPTALECARALQGAALSLERWLFAAHRAAMDAAPPATPATTHATTTGGT